MGTPRAGCGPPTQAGSGVGRGPPWALDSVGWGGLAPLGQNLHFPSDCGHEVGALLPCSSALYC